MGTVSLMPKLNQNGAVPLIAIGAIAVVAIAGFFLISKNSSKPQKPPPTQQQGQKAASESSPIQWQTYKDEERGYSIKHPEGWIVENSSGQNSRIIKVTAANKSAFVIIEAIAGSKLEGEGDIDEVVRYFEEKIKKDTGYKITGLTKKTEGDTSGFIVEGEYVDAGKETPEDKKILFEERLMVAKNGRGMRMHRAYTKITKEINQPISSEIIKSLSLN